MANDWKDKSLDYYLNHISSKLYRWSTVVAPYAGMSFQNRFSTTAEMANVTETIASEIVLRRYINAKDFNYYGILRAATTVSDVRLMIEIKDYDDAKKKIYMDSAKIGGITPLKPITNPISPTPVDIEPVIGSVTASSPDNVNTQILGQVNADGSISSTINDRSGISSESIMDELKKTVQVPDLGATQDAANKGPSHPLHKSVKHKNVIEAQNDYQRTDQEVTMYDTNADKFRDGNTIQSTAEIPSDERLDDSIMGDDSNSPTTSDINDIHIDEKSDEDQDNSKSEKVKKSKRKRDHDNNSTDKNDDDKVRP